MTAPGAEVRRWRDPTGPDLFRREGKKTKRADGSAKGLSNLIRKSAHRRFRGQWNAWKNFLKAPHPRRLAITGNIGAGKSLAAHFVQKEVLRQAVPRRQSGGRESAQRRDRSNGRAALDCDDLARRSRERNPCVIQALCEAFPDCVVEGTPPAQPAAIDSQLLADRLFSTSCSRLADSPHGTPTRDQAIVEAIIHPTVLEALREGLALARRQRARLWIVEVPLLFETQWDRLFHETWLLSAPSNRRLARFCRRFASAHSGTAKRAAAGSGVPTKQAIRNRFNAINRRQMRPRQAAARATFCIPSSGARPWLRRALKRKLQQTPKPGA